VDDGVGVDWADGDLWAFWGTQPGHDPVVELGDDVAHGGPVPVALAGGFAAWHWLLLVRDGRWWRRRPVVVAY